MTAPAGAAPAYSSDPDLNTSIQSALDDVGEGVDPETTDGTPEDGGTVEPENGSQTPSPRAEGEAPDGQGTAPAPVGETPQGEAEPAFEPFTYTVNGQERTFEGFHRVPGEGVYVPDDQVPRLQQAMSRAEASEAALRDMHQKTQAYDKVAEWPVWGNDGKQTGTLNGLEAVQQMRVDYEKIYAIASTLQSVLNDPQALLGLFTQDQAGNLALNPREITNLRTAAELAAVRAEQKTRGSFGSPARSATAPSPTQATQSAAPVVSPEQAVPAVQQLATGWGIKGLTADDVNVLAQALPRYVRTATAEDLASDPLLQLGQPVVENSFQALVAHQAALRAQQTTAGQVGKFNAGQSAGRAGQRPAARPQPQTPPTPQPTPNGKRREARASWDAILERGMSDPDVQAALHGER